MKRLTLATFVRPRTRLAALLCGCVLALNGCGGDDGGSAPTDNGGQPPPPPPVVRSGISLFAGALGGTGNLDGAGTEARFAGPNGLALDAAGNLYVADAPNKRIRKLTRAGVVSTLAGSGQSGHADGAGSTATFCNPTELAADPVGNLFVLDRKVVRKVAPDGMVTTVFGDTGVECDNTSQPGRAPLTFPSALAVDRSGTLYLANSSPGAVYRLTPTGVLTKLVGDDTPPPDGFGDLYGIRGLAVDAARNVYALQVRNGDGTVRKIAPDGTLTTLVPASAGLRVPSSIALDRVGNLVIADRFNFAIRTVSAATGAVATLAGIVGQPALVDGPAATAHFSDPTNVAIDGGDGSVYVSERAAGLIRKIDPQGNVTTLAGLAAPGEPEFGPDQATDPAGNLYLIRYGSGLQRIAPDGQVTSVTNDFYAPRAIATDAAGNTYLAQPVRPTTNCPPFIILIDCRSIEKAEVLKVSAQGQVTTLPKVFPADPYPDGSTPEFRRLTALASDAAGNLYLGEDGFGSARPAFSSRIYRLTTAGRLSTVAEGAFQPRSLAVDAAGNLIASLCLRTSLEGSSKALAAQIVQYSPGGTPTVLAGSAAAGFGAADGPGAQATFADCAMGGGGIALDAVGNIYLADTGNSLIRRITPAGLVSTVAGQPGAFGVRLGPLPGSLRFPTDVSLDGAGNLLVGSQHAILRIRLAD